MQPRNAVHPAAGKVDLPNRLRRQEAVTRDRCQPGVDDTLDDLVDRDILTAQGEVVDPRLERR